MGYPLLLFLFTLLLFTLLLFTLRRLRRVLALPPNVWVRVKPFRIHCVAPSAGGAAGVSLPWKDRVNKTQFSPVDVGQL